MHDLQTENNQNTALALNKLLQIADAIETITTRSNGDLYIKFKKDLIIECGGNYATITEGFNIQYAKQIHFNPDIEKNMFKKMIIENFDETNTKIIEKTNELENQNLLI